MSKITWNDRTNKTSKDESQTWVVGAVIMNSLKAAINALYDAFDSLSSAVGLNSAKRSYPLEDENKLASIDPDNIVYIGDDITGNASTATALETAVDIAGNSFDGSASIDIASTDLTDTANIVKKDAVNEFTNDNSFAGEAGYNATTDMGSADTDFAHKKYVDDLAGDERFSSEITTISNIIEPDVDTVDGVLPQEIAKGITLVNSVENGDFSDGTTGWTTSNFSIANGVATYNGISTGNIQTSLTVKTAEKWAISFKISNSTNCKLFFSDSTGTTLFTELNAYFTYHDGTYVVFGTASKDATNIRIYTVTSSGTFDITNIEYTNMTALGIEDYTEAQMLALVENGYIDGMQGTGHKKVSSRDSLGNIKNSNYLPPLNSTGTIQDTVNCVTGIHTKNCSSKTAIASGTVINTTNFPLAKLNGSYTLLQDDKVLMTGIVDGTDTTTDAGDLIYELATSVQTRVRVSPSHCYADGDRIVENKISNNWIQYVSTGIDLSGNGYNSQSISLACRASSSSEDGQEILDIADFVETGTGTNIFTNSNLVVGEYVWVESEYSDGRTTIEDASKYPINLTSSVNSLSEKVVKIDESVKVQDKQIKQLQDAIDAKFPAINGFFTTVDNKTITIENGLVTSIV